MEISSQRHQWGPNAWAAEPVLDAAVTCTQAEASAPVARHASAIDAALPERATIFGRFSSGSDGVPDRLRLLAEVALTLQAIARPPACRFHRVVPTRQQGLYRLAIAAPDPTLAAECLRRAATILEAADRPAPLDLGECREDLVDIADDACLGPSTMLMVRAAENRGIPWQRIGDQSLVQLGHGARQRRIWTAETDRTSAIAESISRNKQLTKRLIAAAGVPVPRGRVVDSAEEAWEAAQWIGGPFVLKPLDGNHGRGVFLNLTTREEVEQAYPFAADEGRSSDLVVVEEYVKGVEHRLLVVGGSVRACAKGEYVYVTGDGRETVAALIDSQVNSNDPRRGSSETMPNKTVKLDSVVLTELAQQGLGPETIPDRGQKVLVKRSGTHGPDVLTQVHPEIAAAAVRAARAVGLDIAGIDLVAQDISRPLHEQGAKVCEVNAGPQLLIHSNPSSGPGIPVGEAIVDELFAAGENGRIPVTVVNGAHAAATAVLTERMLRSAGRVAGITCTAGKWVAGWRCSGERHTTATAARDLLTSPEIDAAVFELDWRSVVAEGMPLDRCDVLVLLDADEPATSGAAGPCPSAEEVDSHRAAVAAMTRSVRAPGVIVVSSRMQDTVVGLADSGVEIVVLDGPDTHPSGQHSRVCLDAGAIVCRRGGATSTIVSGNDATPQIVTNPVAAMAAVAVGLGLKLPQDAIRAAFSAR